MMPALQNVEVDKMTPIESKLYILLCESKVQKTTGAKIETILRVLEEVAVSEADFTENELVIFESLNEFAKEAKRRYKNKHLPLGFMTSHFAIEDFEKILLVILAGKSGQKYQCLHLKNGASTRLVHLFDTALVNFCLAKRMGADAILAWLIGLIHDSAQVAWSHRGEKAIQRISGKNVSHEVDVAELFGNTQVDIRVIDGGASHCGEHFTPRREVNVNKEMSIGNIKSSFRAQAAGTLEGVLVLYTDKIAFVCRDIQEGFRFNVVSWERYNQYDNLPDKVKGLVKEILESDAEIVLMQELIDLVKEFYGPINADEKVEYLIQDPVSAIAEIRDLLLDRIAQSSTASEVRLEERDYRFFNKLQDWKERAVYLNADNLWIIWKTDEKIYQLLVTLKELMIEKRLETFSNYRVVSKLMAFIKNNVVDSETPETRILSRFLLIMGDQELLDYYDELKAAGILRK
ncbi:MAG: HD domain-containing protein [Deltaproteobacteria bacterium]